MSSQQLEFKAWPKTPRLNRVVVVTEKIDGTNAAVIIQPVDNVLDGDFDLIVIADDGQKYAIGAQSRNRLITPAQDNHGFAAWVWSRAADLVRLLGPGYHYGEWWGHGVTKRNYGLARGEKRFSLFNISRYKDIATQTAVPEMGLVPLLYEGPFSEAALSEALDDLRRFGSFAVPTQTKPVVAEGIVVFHTASRQTYKVTLENDAAPKSMAAAA